MGVPAFTIGIEEEYFIVDCESRELVPKPDCGLLKAATAHLGSQVSTEYLQCQLELRTKPHASLNDAVMELGKLRAFIATEARNYGYAVIAASTHPFSNWRNQSQTLSGRYTQLHEELGQIMRRMQVCGMHIHIGIADNDLKVDLMNHVSFLLPYILAFSCSSPFWGGEDTGLSSYRLAVFDALPRTGLPDHIDTYEDYKRQIDDLVSSGSIEDSSKIWWDIRLSQKYPTVEQRISDVCSDLRDVAAIAALFQSAMVHAYRSGAQKHEWRHCPKAIIRENRWIAQRYGVKGRMIDHRSMTRVSLDEVANGLIGQLQHDAKELGCLRELVRLRDISANGTSADRQRNVYESKLQQGETHKSALRSVADHLIAEF